MKKVFFQRISKLLFFMLLVLIGARDKTLEGGTVAERCKALTSGDKRFPA